MPCYHPLQAWQKGSAAPVFSLPVGRARSLLLPCGVCVGCRLARATANAVRCMHEASLHEANSFVTLTYDPAHLPADLSLDYSHYQLFMKRLREHLRRRELPPVRFFMSGEYGEFYSRPHYHACLFGFSPVDKLFFKTSKDGSKLYKSAMLDSFWGQGFTSVGDVTFESAAYVARYVMKKQLGKEAGDVREITDVETGEIRFREHEFAHMSLRPGIGAGWFEKFGTDVYPSDEVIVRGRSQPVPRYYDVLLGRSDEAEFLPFIKAERLLRAERHFDDSSPKRLRVRELVTKARVSLLKRSID